MPMAASADFVADGVALCYIAQHIENLVAASPLATTANSQHTNRVLCHFMC